MLLNSTATHTTEYVFVQNGNKITRVNVYVKVQNINDFMKFNLFLNANHNTKHIMNISQ